MSFSTDMARLRKLSTAELHARREASAPTLEESRARLAQVRSQAVEALARGGR